MGGTEVESSAGRLGCFTFPKGDIRLCPRPPKEAQCLQTLRICLLSSHPSLSPNHLIEVILVNIFTLEMGEKQNL